MAKITKRNVEEGSSTNMIKTCDSSGVAPWSDIYLDVLFLIAMKLGVVDFLACSRVCKSWRSWALSNKIRFIVSRPPLSMSISTDANEKQCHLEDLEGRKIKAILPYFANRNCVGVTCGYLILCGEKIRDFWLVNPVTRHELYFPFSSPLSDDVVFESPQLGALLVLSPSISESVFIVFGRYLSSNKIWFCIAGEGYWTFVYIPFRIHDVHAFKGKIYALDSKNLLSEVRLYPTPKVTSLETKNILKPDIDHPRFVSLGENLYVMDRFSEHPYKMQELNLSKMEWVSCEKTGEEYAFYLSNFKHGVAVIKLEPWADFHSLYRRYAVIDKSGKGYFFKANMWYTFHDCLDVSLLDD